MHSGCVTQLSDYMNDSQKIIQVVKTDGTQVSNLETRKKNRRPMPGNYGPSCVRN